MTDLSSITSQAEAADFAALLRDVNIYTFQVKKNADDDRFNIIELG